MSKKKGHSSLRNQTEALIRTDSTGNSDKGSSNEDLPNTTMDQKITNNDLTSGESSYFYSPHLYMYILACSDPKIPAGTIACILGLLRIFLPYLVDYMLGGISSISTCILGLSLTSIAELNMLLFVIINTMFYLQATVDITRKQKITH